MEADNLLDDFLEPEEGEIIRYAGFIVRAGATIIDGILHTVVIVGIFVLLVWLFMDVQGEAGSGILIAGLVFFYLGLPIVNIISRACFESSRYQATPGKMIMDLQVINRHGQRISFIQGLGRNLSKIISALILYIGYLFPLWTSKKQALHDIMAETYVVFKNK